MSNRRALCITAVACLAATALAAQTKPRHVNGVHEDSAYGFKMRVPDKWRFVPVDIDERWIVGKYVGNREYYGKVQMVRLTPDMYIVHFSPEKAKITEKVETHGDTTYKRKTVAFRDYKEWFDAWMKGSSLGYFWAKDGEEQKFGDVAVKYYEVTMTDNNEPVMKVFTWVYEREGGEQIAVQFRHLAEWVDGSKPEFDRCFQSFRFTEKDGSLNLAAAGDDLESPMWTRDRSKWRELPKLERVKIRQEMEAKRREKNLANVPEGWKTQESRSKRFMAITHTDKDYTNLVLDTAEATWEWLDKRFGDLSDEYVMAGVIRICGDYDEYVSYRGKSADVESFSGDDREIVDFKDVNAGSRGGGQANLVTGLFQNYWYDKEWLVYAYAPGWLQAGVGQYLGSAELKGRRLVFKPSTQEKVRLREAERENALRTFHELITTSAYDWPREQDAHWRFRWQLSALIRFLESNDAQRIKPLRGFLENYVKAVIDAGEEWRKSQKPSEAATTEAEEEERARGRSEAGKKRAKFIIDKATEAAANFSQKEWQLIEAAWRAFVTK